MKSPDGRECSTFLTEKILSLAGKRTTKLYLSNPNQIELEKIEVDGCAITEGPRCDWLVVTAFEQIYVELKASKIDRAFEQLEAAIRKLSFRAQRPKKRCFVVSRRVPKITTSIQKYKDRFHRDSKASLAVVRDGGTIALLHE